MRKGHLGLTGMRERAELFGGELSVTSKPGEGATVGLRFPWANEDRQGMHSRLDGQSSVRRTG
jgi:nitrate/nitrite-specific signal transduction histidine kinase